MYDPVEMLKRMSNGRGKCRCDVGGVGARSMCICVYMKDQSCINKKKNLFMT